MDKRWVEILRLILSLAAIYAAADDDLRIKIMWWTAKSCQKMARGFGYMGLKAETEFYRLCEMGRMN